MAYTSYIRFLLPLVLATVFYELGLQVLNGGMARVSRAAETLASFGLAWGLMGFVTSPLMQCRQLGLVLVDNRPSLAMNRGFVLVLCASASLVLASLSLGPVGRWAIEGLHGVDEPMGSMVRYALLWLVPIPFLKGMGRFYSGLLLRAKRTEVVSGASLTSIGASILAVFVLLPLGIIRDRPIRLPLMVTYAGLLAEVAVLYWGYRRFPLRRMSRSGEAHSFAYVVRFFWPLALIMAIQGASRPLINLFVSRGPDAGEALAVLTVVYALGHLPYSWLNETRNLAPAFREDGESLPRIRRFAAACCLLSVSVAAVMFWTPLRGIILQDMIGLDTDLAALCWAPLVIFSFFALPVTVRAYFHGIGLLEHRTGMLAPSAPARIAAIWIVLMVLPSSSVAGATRGIAALMAGFVLEAIAVWWGVRGRPRLRSASVGQDLTSKSQNLTTDGSRFTTCRDRHR